MIEEGKSTTPKFRNITLHTIGVNLPTEVYTATGWPSVGGDALKILAGKISSEYDFMDHAPDLQSVDDGDACETVSNEYLGNEGIMPEYVDTSDYGTALQAFESEEKGKEACHAIAALCQVCSIDSLISNFILPLQVSLLLYPYCFCLLSIISCICTYIYIYVCVNLRLLIFQCYHASSSFSCFSTANYVGQQYSWQEQTNSLFTKYQYRNWAIIC